ncbi:MAG TPA: 1-deoxy-D-xylulose-5-phosphate synthase N-terminal domain-containing protein [Candidatus Dormibacteraeota bacterium]|nr:1-deoxy-D-xylulose-5-phosphate synthase N-terminal domain-containing protein [Candidatus Dormibacteraeota bacterium]
MALLAGDEKHEPAAASTLDVLWVLYARVLRVSAAAPRDPERDRFLLSKGHGPAAYYAVLAARGFVPVEALAHLGSFDGILGHHPDRTRIPGVEISSGSLGHGLPVAVGMALGLRAQGRTAPRVVCLVGDGELDEGSNHEAIAVAGALRLGALTAIVVDNHSATHRRAGALAARFATEGWATATVDGRDRQALEVACRRRWPDRPGVVVAQVAPRR